jgi:uncharacterized circularly permuted ATP-grasp superfamily protein/uncharacterized alpha-E superfamily protein
MPRPAPALPPEASDLLAGYRPSPGVADELFEADGRMRPVWRPLISYLANLSPAARAEHFARGANYLRDAGVYYRRYTATPEPEREWPLSPIPLVMDQSEWSTICRGLAQRADLLERVMADLYGPGSLVSDGHLPADLIARAPGWLRPMVGIQPASGHYLHLLSFEISRNPDGTWFVLGDRTQAPSGAGFALENRIATTRIYADLYAHSNVHRLAGFFRSFREAMDGLPGPKSHRAAILTPGPNNAGYFEHTYIARYLGLLLLEGDDLMVRDGQVMVRTVEGPLPIGAIWRRLDSEYMDPLELREDSRLGTPGTVNALRYGALNMINALGSGVLEIRAMMAFLPAISEVLTGEKLLLPNIATWWCGQAAERSYVAENRDRMIIGHALDHGLPLDASTAATRDALAFEDDPSAGLPGRGRDFVGQERVTLSTTPVYANGRLVPRPVTVRITAARTPDGWVFMPGGYARIGASDDSTALAMQYGGSVADVWVVGDTPVAAETLLGAGGLQRVEPEALPSRAADNLFWLGRYVERTEGVLRLIRAYHLRLAETGDPDDPRLAALVGLMSGNGVLPDRVVPDGLAALVQAAAASAGNVRDRFSLDGWAALQDIAKMVRQLAATATPGDDGARAMSVLLRKSAGFAGLVRENMYRSAGWRFLAFGRALERADALAAVLKTCTSEEAAEGLDEIAVELGDSLMTHRRRFRGPATRASVLDLLVSDPLNPRSILFQINDMVDLAGDLPNRSADGRPSHLTRLLLPIRSRLTVGEATTIGEADLDRLRAELAEASDLLSSDYLR